MTSRITKVTVAGLAALSLGGLAACSSSGGTTSAADTAGGSTGSTTGSSRPAGQPVSIDFWGWAPGYENSVKLFNASQHKIHVNYSKISPGSKGGYTKILNAVKAGNAPCLAQVGFETLPTFAVAGAVQDISSQTGSIKTDFPDWTWNQVEIGGKAFGIPVDIAPMAMFYRKDLFAKYGITAPPKTWAQYRADAVKIHKANPKAYIGYFGNDAYNFAGLAWQAGAKWFGTANNSWQVHIDDPATKKVAAFWQGMLDDHLLDPVPSFDTALYKGMGNGTILSDVNAVWDAPLIASSVKETSGKWAVAPMPVWNASAPAYGNDGGSPNAVLKGCKNVGAAVQFATWFSTNKASVTNLIKKTGIYPAATAAQSNPALTQGDPFYGGQKIFDVFKAAVPKIDPKFVWGPVMTKTSTALGDGLGKAGTGGTTLSAVLASSQSQTVSEMKAQGLTVSK